MNYKIGTIFGKPQRIVFVYYQQQHSHYSLFFIHNKQSTISTTILRNSLESHIMHTDRTTAEREAAMQVLLHHRHLLNALHQFSIDRLLKGFTLLLRGFVDVLLRRTVAEVAIVESSRNLQTRDINLGRSGNHMALIDTQERDFVQCKGTWKSTATRTFYQTRAIIQMRAVLKTRHAFQHNDLPGESKQFQQ